MRIPFSYALLKLLEHSTLVTTLLLPVPSMLLLPRISVLVDDILMLVSLAEALRSEIPALYPAPTYQHYSLSPTLVLAAGYTIHR